MAKKRVLIITYYWPPSGGAGVQRWLKFVKYLRDFGWEPIIFKPNKAEYPELDYSLQEDVPEGVEIVESDIWEPYHLYKAFTGRKKNEKVQAGFLNERKKPGKLEKIAVWLRGNIFIPDARKFWIRPGVKSLNKWLSTNSVDAIASTGPPHSAHLIALKIKQKHQIPWLADFRDPWTQIDFYDKLMLSKKADRKHKKLEKSVLEGADAVTTVSKHCAIGLNEITDKKVNVITNGFDTDDFQHLPSFQYDEFSITHLGSMNPDRNPFALWDALSELVKENEQFRKDLRIRFIGKTDLSVFEALEKRSLSDKVENLKYLPHDQAVNKAAESAVLLLALNNTPNVMGIAPGKLYEYLALNRPILSVGPPSGDAARIVTEANAGKTIDFDDVQQAKEIIMEWYSRFQNKSLNVESGSIEKFSRKALTEKLSGLLDTITQQTSR
ncbi:MAG: glycosyltransferase family 4 protein [Brumimicrobium sp.]|nr:glycosyltransferase family 4 protein [Brumimicrobium sp.]